MNRYVAQGLAIDLLNEQRVLYVARSLVQAKEALERTASAVWELSPERATRIRVRRVHADYGIAYARGRIRFVNARQVSTGAARGLQFDRAFVDDPLMTDEGHTKMFTELGPGAREIEFV